MELSCTTGIICTSPGNYISLWVGNRSQIHLNIWSYLSLFIYENNKTAKYAPHLFYWKIDFNLMNQILSKYSVIIGQYLTFVQTVQLSENTITPQFVLPCTINHIPKIMKFREWLYTHLLDNILSTPNTENKRSSIWQLRRHWWHYKLSLRRVVKWMIFCFQWNFY